MNEDQLSDFYKDNIPNINSEFKFVEICEIRRGGPGKNVIRLFHNKCGRTIDITYGNFKERQCCKFCSYHRYDHDSFVSRFNERHDADEYMIVSRFESLQDKITLKHNCGKIFSVRADSLLYRGGAKCPCVNGRYTHQYTFNLLKERIADIDSEYELIGPYFDRINEKLYKAVILHKTCNNTFECIAHNFMHNDQRCPHCAIRSKNLIGYKDSKGVVLIERWLQHNQLYYEKEKTFSDLRSPLSKKPLRYDFFIPSLNLIIEFDGKQHSDTHVSKIFTKDKYDRIHLYDSIKNRYCETHGINLIRFDYTQSDKKIICDKLNKFVNSHYENKSNLNNIEEGSTTIENTGYYVIDIRLSE